jgi:hypothetical protein
MWSDLSRRTRQVLLLFTLALSVIGMHHVPFSPHITMSAEAHAAVVPGPAVSAVPEVQPADDPSPGMGHHLLHLCLVVLSAAGGVLLVVWLLFAVHAGGFSFAVDFRRWARRVWRPPGTAGRSLLMSLCVSRT